jgi:hypothetical protein
MNELEGRFRRDFTEMHRITRTITYKELEEHCAKNKLDIKKYLYNPVTMSVGNACLCETCPYYLQVDNGFGRHLEADYFRIPAFRKTISKHCHDPVETIWKLICQQKYIDPTRFVKNDVIDPEKYPFKDDALKVITRLKEVYASAKH